MNRLYIIFIFVMVLCLFSIPVRAQDYVIFHSGDKLAGAVVRNFDYNNYRSLVFLSLIHI